MSNVTKAALYDSTLNHIQKTLQTIERAPGMWGGPETLELKVLMLVELRQAMTRPYAIGANPFETREAYIRFVRSVNGEPSSLLLSELLRRAGMTSALPRLLADFVRWMDVEYPPEAGGQATHHAEQSA